MDAGARVKDGMNFLAGYATLPAVSILCLVLLVHSVLKSKRGKLPPGPTGLPFFGYIPFIPTNYIEKLTTLFKKYGDVFCVRLGSFDVVFLADYDLIKEAYIKDVFNHRPSFSFLSLGPTNLADWSGEEWKEQRKFSVRVFKQLGIGKAAAENMIMREIDVLLRTFEQQNEDPVQVLPPIAASISNVISLLIAGERFDYKHPTMKILHDAFLSRDNIPSLIGVVSYVPVLSRLMYGLPFTPIATLLQNRLKGTAYMTNRMRELKRTFNCKEDEPKCFIEAYLKEIEENQKGKFFDDRHLIGCVRTFFEAASNTTNDFLVWFLLYMMVFPEVQQRMRKEVDEVVGSSRVSTQMRQHMPYTEAVIHELHRHVSPVPIGLVHAVAEDVELGEYLLPKDTHVIIATFQVHSNPKYFPNPDKFDPERFISKEGTFARDEHVISFGSGRRVCPGEPMANFEIFLYVVSFIQKFVIQAPQGRHYTTEGIIELFGRNPKDSPVEVVFRRR